MTLAAVAVVASVGKAVTSSAQTRALQDEPSLKFIQFLRQLHYTEQFRFHPFAGSAHLLSSNAKRDVKRVLVKVILNAEEGKLFADINVLLDAGASISAINKKFYDKHREDFVSAFGEPKPVRRNFSLTYANEAMETGELFYTMLDVMTSDEAGNRSYVRGRFIILPIVGDMIIGTDVLLTSLFPFFIRHIINTMSKLDSSERRIFAQQQLGGVQKSNICVPIDVMALLLQTELLAEAESSYYCKTTPAPPCTPLPTAATVAGADLRADPVGSSVELVPHLSVYDLPYPSAHDDLIQGQFYQPWSTLEPPDPGPQERFMEEKLQEIHLSTDSMKDKEAQAKDFEKHKAKFDLLKKTLENIAPCQ